MDTIQNNNTDFNQEDNAHLILSHNNKRIFQPHQLTPPRHIGEADRTSAVAVKPLVIEIGAGKGKHAIEYALSHPKDNIIAIERTKNKFEAFLKQTQRIEYNNKNQQTLSNLKAVHADAIPYIVHTITPSSVDKVFILYPNPEPHNRNQQWLNMPFFEFLLSRLVDGGQIILASNIVKYMDNAEYQAKQVWQLNCSRHVIAKNSARTHFEIKYLRRGETCWQLELTKPTNYRTRFDRWQVTQI